MAFPGSTAVFDVVFARLRQAESFAADPRRGARDAHDLYRAAEAEGASRVAAHAAVMFEAARLRAGELDRVPITSGSSSSLGSRDTSKPTSCSTRSTPAARSRPNRWRWPTLVPMQRCSGGSAHGQAQSLGVWGMQAFGIRREQLRLQELESMLAAAGSTGRTGLQGLLAACRLEAGDRAGAQALVDSFVADALPTLARDWVHEAAVALVADVAFELGVFPGPELYEQLVPCEGQLVVMCSAGLVVGRVDRYLGQLVALTGDHDRAIEHLTRARELDTASGCRLWAGWAAHDEAMVRAARSGPGDARRADELLGLAREGAEWVGSLRLARAAAV